MVDWRNLSREDVLAHDKPVVDLHVTATCGGLL